MKVIIDTDIGDDFDDIVTLAVALASPEIELLAVTTVGGDTPLRARLARRFLAAAGRAEVPVAIGSRRPVKATFSHRRWAEAGPPLQGTEPDAAEVILSAARAAPGAVTVLAIGPLSNLADALARDPDGFAQIGRIVLMGGSVRRGYRDPAWRAASGPAPEYNIVQDIPAAKAVFASGAALTVAPLDATMAVFDEVARSHVFTRSTPVTDALALTYLQWAAVSGRPYPVLFDTVALAQAIDPTLCRTERMRLVIDDDGRTLIAEGPANAEVCVDCDDARFIRWMMPRLTGEAPRT